MNPKLSFDVNRPIDVISMGRVAVDLYAEQIGVPLEDVQSFQKYLGGCAGNIAVGTARLGMHSAMFSCIGTDAMGRFLQQELLRENVAIHLLKESNKHLTGLVILGIDPPDRFPLIFYRNQCADMQLEKSDIKINDLENAKAIVITGTCLSTDSMRETTHDVVRKAKQSNTRIIFDIDYRPVLWKLTESGNGETRYLASTSVSQHYQAILADCDVIVGTEEEIMIAGNDQHIQQALSNIRSMTNAPIVMKRGSKGSSIFFQHLDQPLNSPAMPVTVLNVLGAGDAFMSGLLRGLLFGESWETSSRYANAAGAIVVTRHGCAPAMPTFLELTQFIATREVMYA
jgi:5-dehydro-2-deoxygluconokinase